MTRPVLRMNRAAPWLGRGEFRSTPRVRNLDAELAAWTSILATFDPEEARNPHSGEWVKVGDLTSLSEWGSYHEELTSISRENNDRRDHVLERIAQIQGFDANPAVGNLDPKKETLYRGFGDRYDQSNGPELARRFVDGDYYGSTGMHGNGAYFTTSKERASGYGFLLEAQLHDGVKIANEEDMWSMIEGSGVPSEWKHIVGDDPGRLAAMLGFDVLKPTGGTSVIVLNRGALKVAPIK